MVFQWFPRLSRAQPPLQVADLFMSAIERVTSVQRCVQIGTSKEASVVENPPEDSPC